jgi:hypothetical protein
MSDDLRYITLPDPPLGTENEASEGREDVVGKNGVWPETALDLNTSANLPEAPVATGMSPDSLAGVTRSALSDGFEVVPETETMLSIIRIDSPADTISPGARPEVCVSRKY